MARYLYSELSAAVEARLNCQGLTGKTTQTVCTTCGLDIEQIAPYSAHGWRDRGNNTTCNTDGTVFHRPVMRNAEWFDKHSETIDQMVKDFLPHGSGFDCGTTLDTEQSHAEKLVFHTSFHHMDGGYYDGWTEHTVTVTPSFSGINIRVSGRNRNDIKDYIHESFDIALRRTIEWDKGKARWFDPELRKAAEEYQRKVASGEIA